MSARPKVYLAGPEVFLPDAVAIGAEKCRLCEARGLRGLYPLDNEGQGSAYSIYAGNRAFIDAADAVVANLTPFRGPSVDVGTAFEVGYAAARGLPIFGYTNAKGSFQQRVVDALGADDRGERDRDGLSIESFGLVDNLMIECAIRTSGGIIVEVEAPPAGVREAIGELSAYAVCLDHLARFLSAVR